MATKSFLKDVVITDPKFARQFVDTLSASAEKEEQRKQKQEPFELSRPCSEVKADEIKDFFGME